MTKQAEKEQESFDHGQARLLRTSVTPSQFGKVDLRTAGGLGC